MIGLSKVSAHRGTVSWATCPAILQGFKNLFLIDNLMAAPRHCPGFQSQNQPWEGAVIFSETCEWVGYKV